MAQSDGPLTVETTSVGTAGDEVLGDAFNGGQIGRLIIEAKFASYATHKILTGIAVGECD